jgi:crotonobetainyl-CoA:carnitine CoA-transferase CaiB-like acyl-CoA transferase
MHPDDERAAGLLAVEVHERFERLVVVSVTPFGLDGPWANWRSCDLVALALGSPLNSCGYDDHSIPPIRPGGDQGFQSAASFAQMGVMLALLQREHTGRGDLVQVSMHDCLAVGAELANPYWFYPEVTVKRQTCRHAQPSPTQPALFECGDGHWVYFVFFVLQQKGWYLLLDWLSSMDLAVDLINPEYEDPVYRQENVGHIQEIIETFFLLQTAEEAYRTGQARGLPIGPINSPDEVLADEHLNARGFFQHVETNGRSGTYPRLPLHFSAFPTADITPAPRLGEHSAGVLRTP